MRMGCFVYNSTAPVTYGKVTCTNNEGSAGVFELYNNSQCTLPASPATMAIPLPPDTILGTCHIGVPPADGSLTLCNKGDFVPDAKPVGLTFTYYDALTCGVTPVTTVANYPTGRCSLGGPRATPSFPYRMANCYNATHYTVGSVRSGGGGGAHTRALTSLPSPPLQFSDAACTVRGTTDYYPMACSAVAGNALVYGKASTEVCNTASAALASTTTATAVLLLAAAVAKSFAW